VDINSEPQWQLVVEVDGVEPERREEFTTTYT
jgi:hypothetical protein